MSILMIKAEEARYEQQLVDIAGTVSRSSDIKLVLISGASCSGKTTTTAKLSRYIAREGKHAVVVSIDDFYKDYVDSPTRPDGSKDLETIESIDLDYLHFFLSELMAGRTADLPRFDFISQKRSEEYTPVRLGDNDILLIEGLHALNPRIYSGFVEEQRMFRVYLYVRSHTDADPRFLRRLVRDYYHRGAPADLTFSMWNGVREGERLYIDPYKGFADFSINTYFSYEKGIFAPDAVAILADTPSDSIYRPVADRIISELKKVKGTDKTLVPSDSVLREFMKD